MTDFFDSPGPMAKSAADVLVLSEILLNQSFKFSHLGPWEGLCVGFLDPKVWNMASELCTQFEGTAEQMVCYEYFTRCPKELTNVSRLRSMKIQFPF